MPENFIFPISPSPPLLSRSRESHSIYYYYYYQKLLSLAPFFQINISSKTFNACLWGKGMKLSIHFFIGGGWCTHKYPTNWSLYASHVHAKRKTIFDLNQLEGNFGLSLHFTYHVESSLLLLNLIEGLYTLLEKIQHKRVHSNLF